MKTYEKLIHDFYSAFQKRDYQTMQSMYAHNATFNDPVFQNLNAEQTKAMWEMLCRRAKDFELSFENIKVDQYSGSADWRATYTFSATGKKIVNQIHSEFIFENGKIVQHVDEFYFYKWSKQAFGTKAALLGWTPFFRQKVRSSAMKSLKKSMTK
jgi:ketosteroid isomerase-like protein